MHSSDDNRDLVRLVWRGSRIFRVSATLRQMSTLRQQAYVVFLDSRIAPDTNLRACNKTPLCAVASPAFYFSWGDLHMAAVLVPDTLLGLIEPLLPKPLPKPQGRRPRLTDRACLTGIIFVLRSGIPWRMLPKRLGCGSGMTCWRRLRDWQQDGICDLIHFALLDWLFTRWPDRLVACCCRQLPCAQFLGAADLTKSDR